jgi:exonuclease III
LRAKIEESSASIICLQETKRELFDLDYLKKFCHRNLDKFEFTPSVGASGGLIVIWSGRLFSGTLMHSNSYALTIHFICKLSGKIFHLTNIYGPCSSVGKVDFVNCLYNFDTSTIEDWILAGDFNLIRSPEDRNRLGADINEMLLFNDLIQHLDLAEIQIQNRQYTWSNMQDVPLLEKLDWVFTSSSWI